MPPDEAEQNEILGELSSGKIIPQNYPEVATKTDLNTFGNNVNNKFTKMENLMFAVVLVLVVMLGSLVLETFRFNSTVYKEYSEKLEINQEYKKSIDELLNQNKENQDIILQQQKQIINLSS